MKKYIGLSIITFNGLLLFLSLSKIYDPTNILGNYICGIDVKPLLLFGFYTFIIGIIITIILLVFDLLTYLISTFKK